MQTVNGARMLLNQCIVFKCRFEQIRRYKREDMDEVFWQMVMTDGKSGEKIYSSLYTEEVLKSCSKLKKTILARYHNVGEPKTNTLSWYWAQSELMQMFEVSEIIEIPSKAGWFKEGDSWRFWVANSTEKVLLSEQIKKFHVGVFPELRAEDVISDLLNASCEITDCMEYSGVLLILRMCAIFARLTDDLPLEMGVTFVGKGALEVAKSFLRTMHNDVDIVNLDADRQGKIQEKVEILQDTPVIFISSNPDSKSTQNRLQRIMSWLGSGYIEGRVIGIPFIFCLQRFSKAYPLEDMVLVEADRITISEEATIVFEQLQSYVIKSVEMAGSYYVQEFKRMYKEEKSESGDENKFLSLIYAVADIVLEIFDRNISDDSYSKLEDLLYCGADSIVEQLTKGGHALSEVFQKKMEDLANSGALRFVSRDKCPSITSGNVIFYDDEYYYFTSEAQDGICEQIDIDYKTLLSIKQQLAEQDLVKLYKTGTIVAENWELIFWYAV